MTLHDSCPEVPSRIALSLQDGFPSVYDRFSTVYSAPTGAKTSANQAFDRFRRSVHRLKTAKTVKNSASSIPRVGAADFPLFPLFPQRLLEWSADRFCKAMS